MQEVGRSGFWAVINRDGGGGTSLPRTRKEARHFSETAGHFPLAEQTANMEDKRAPILRMRCIFVVMLNQVDGVVAVPLACSGVTV